MASKTISGSAKYNGTTRTVSLTVTSDPGSTSASWSVTSSPSSGTRPYTKIRATVGNTNVVNTSYPSSFPSNANGNNFATYGGTRTGTCTVPAYGDVALSLGCGVGHNNNTDISVSGTLSKPRPTWTVSYNANGGSSTPGSTTVYQGEACTLAGAISRNKATSTANQTITISYNANGGSSTPSNSTGTAVNTTTTTYSFSKWAAGSTSGTQYSAGASYTPSGNTTMYAIWSSSSSTARTSNPSITLRGAISRANTTVYSYNVSYNANGGSSTPATQTATRIRSYSFGGWNTNSSGTGTNRSASTAYTFSENATLYAKWTQSESGGSITLPGAISRANSSVAGYSVTYNANGGSGAPATQTSANRTTTYTFNKWAAGSASGTQYSAGASYTPSAATTMYATWNSSTPTESAWTCSSTIPTRTGYTFLGWSESATATSATYTAGTAYTLTSAKTLYAVWKINSYTIDINGLVDNISLGNINGYGKFDMYINDVLVGSQLTDYNQLQPYGTSYELKNITPDWGIKYNGVQSGIIKGTVGVGNVTTTLSFTTLPVVVNANVNGAWEQGILYVNVNGEWRKAKALNIRQTDDWKRLDKFDFSL